MEMNALDVLNAMKKGEESPTKTNEPEKNIPNDMASDSKYKVLIKIWLLHTMEKRQSKISI